MTVHIKYRSSTTATVPSETTAKGTPLTNLEIDGNFRSLKDSVETIETDSNIAKYNATTANFTGTLQNSGSNVLTQSDVDDSPVNGETDVPVSSNWAYDHENAALAHSITNASEINEDLVDSDEIPVYNLSATANRKSLLSRLWTYIKSKISEEPLKLKFVKADGTETNIDITNQGYS